MGRIANAIRALLGEAGGGGSLLARLTPHSQVPRRGTREILQAYRTHPWFRAVASKVATRVASVPLRLYEQRGRERVLVEKHELLDTLKKPNGRMTTFDLLYLTQVWLDTKGEGFWIKERNDRREVVALYPVPPHWMVGTPSRTQPWFQLSYGTVQQALPLTEVLWFLEPDPENPYGRGVGIGEALADEIDTDEFAAKQVKSFFYNGTVPDTLVGMEGGDKSAAEALKEKWAAEHRGFWNKNRAYFTNAKITVERLDTTFKDMQLVQLRQGLRDTVVQVFGVPPEVLGIIENSNRATIESADYLLTTGVLAPRLRRLEMVLAQLAAEAGDGLTFAFDNVVPENKEFALSVMQARPEAFTHNEVRKLAGLAEADGLDVFPEPASFGLGALTARLSDDPPWARTLPGRRTRELPARREFGEGDVDNVLERLRPERLTTELTPVWKDQTESWGKRVLDELGATAKFDLLNPLIAPHVEEFAGDRIKGLVDDVTRQKIRDTLLEGVRAGEAVRDLKDRVEDVFDEADTTRAEVIARTEVLRSSNWATTEAFRVSGVVEEREWVATRDGRTRAEHAALDGVKKKLDEPFEIDGDEGMHPGGFTRAENSVNCRCTTVAVISDELEDEEEAAPRRRDEKDLDAAWRAFDAALRPWERDAKKALRRGFDRQRRDVLKAMDDVG